MRAFSRAPLGRRPRLAGQLCAFHLRAVGYATLTSSAVRAGTLIRHNGAVDCTRLYSSLRPRWDRTETALRRDINLTAYVELDSLSVQLT